MYRDVTYRQIGNDNRYDIIIMSGYIIFNNLFCCRVYFVVEYTIFLYVLCMSPYGQCLPFINNLVTFSVIKYSFNQLDMTIVSLKLYSVLKTAEY